MTSPGRAVEPRPADETIVLSVVVPAHDEAPNLARLVAEVRAALEPAGVDWELIVVDDGSGDDTPAVLARLATAEPRLRTLRLPTRSGQTAALAAGLHAARGRLLATLDADLQCPPGELPSLLAALGDADLACGVRVKRSDPASRRLTSALANLTRRAVLAPRVRDLACPLRVFRADALARIEALTPLFDGAHRWLPALAALAGLRVVQRPVAHQPRAAGCSKYTTRGRLLPVLAEIGAVLGLAARRSRTWRVALGLALLALASLPFLVALGDWPLIEPDEGRNAEVAREMLVLGHWSVPHLNGLPYLDKPVLFFWMVAGAFRALGVSELAARLPSALAALALVAVAYDLARLLVGRGRAVLAAAALATAPIVLAYARLVIFDMPLTALVTAALACFVHARLGGNHWRWLPLAGLAMGLATLTKGPVGIVVPLLAWAAGRGALPAAPRRSGPGPALAAAAMVAIVVVPWLAVVVRERPDFLRYALLDETLLRFTSPERFHRAGPVWFYAETLAWALGVWGIVLAALVPTLVRVWRSGEPEARAIAFSVRAAGAVVLFFTCCASKRPHYVLPAVVPLALLVAIGVAADPARAVTTVRAVGRWAAVAGGVAVVVALYGLEARGNFDVVSPRALTAAGLFLAAWGIAAAGGRRPAAAVVSCVLFAPGLGAVLLAPLGAWAESRSSRELAAYIDPPARVVCFDTFRSSLPFYLRRPVVVASDSPRPLASNYMAAERERLHGHAELVPERKIAALLEEDGFYVLASRWNSARLTRLAGRRLEPLFSDRLSVLFAPRG